MSNLDVLEIFSIIFYGFLKTTCTLYIYIMFLSFLVIKYKRMLTIMSILLVEPTKQFQDRRFLENLTPISGNILQVKKNSGHDNLEPTGITMTSLLA